MPAAWLDSKADLDLQIGNQTGITFTSFANGDNVGQNSNGTAFDYNIATRAFPATFPANLKPGIIDNGGTDNPPVGLSFTFGLGNARASQQRQGIIGIRNSTNGQWYWRLRILAGMTDYVDAMYLGFHASNGTFYESLIHSTPFIGGSGYPHDAIWFLELREYDGTPSNNDFALRYALKKTTTSSDSIAGSGDVGASIAGVGLRVPSSTEEMVVSIFNGSASDTIGFIGKIGLFSTVPTFAERHSLAMAMFSI